MASPSPEKQPNSAFRWFATFAVARPWLVLGVGALFAVLAGISIYGIRISTSRYHLVSAEENAYQKRLLAFFDEFGIPDAMVVVLSGSTPEEQRRVGRALCAEIEREPEFKGRTLCRIDPHTLAEVAILWDPKAVAGALEASGPVGSGAKGLAATVEGGLPAWIGAVEKNIGSALEGGNTAKAQDPEQIRQGPAMLAKALRALDAELAGKDGLGTFDLAAAARGRATGPSVDEAGYLVGGGGAYHLIALFPALPGSEGYELKPLVEKVRKTYSKVDLGDVRPALTGLPAIASDELDAVDRGLEISTIGTTLGIIALLLLGYRSFRYSVMALVPLGVGTVMTIALAKLLFHGLNIITSSFVSVLMGIGINFALFVLSRYSEELRAGRSQSEALEEALAQTGAGLAISAVTTILAFATVMTTSFTAFKQLGLLVGLGLIVMLLLTVLVTPALAMVLNRDGKRTAAQEFVGLERLEPAIRRGMKPLLAVGLALAVFGGVYANRLHFNARYFDFLPTKAESVRGLSVIEADKSASPVVANVPAADVETTRSLTKQLRALPSVGVVDSATDLLPELTTERQVALRAALAALGTKPDFEKLRARPRSAEKVIAKLRKLDDAFDEVAFAMRKAELPTDGIDDVKRASAALAKTLAALPDDGKEALGAIELGVADVLERAWTTAENVSARGHYEPSDLPSVFRARYASKNAKALALFVQPGIDIWDEARAATFAGELRSVAPNASGFAMEVDVYQSDIKRSFTLACYLTTGLALLTCLFGFRNLKDSLLAMMPVAVGLAAMMGFMAVFDVHVNVANIAAFPLSLGMGVEAGAHIMNRCRQSASERGGRAALRDMTAGTGTAVMLASATTIVGFGALILADYRAMKSLGVIMCVGMSTNLFAALVILPALLLALKRAE